MVEEALKFSFSLHDVLYTLPQSLPQYRAKLQSKKRNEEIEIRRMLESNFYFRKLRIDDFYNKLKPYFDKWNRYIRICAEIAFWEEVEGLLHRERDLMRKKHGELEEAKVQLDELRIHTWEIQSASGTEYADGVKIFDRAQLHEKIDEALRHDLFCREDVEQMIVAVNEEYVRSPDFHVRLERRPQIHLVYHKGLEPEIKLGSDCFNWIKHPVSYISKAELWELRMYTDFGENVI